MDVQQMAPEHVEKGRAAVRSALGSLEGAREALRRVADDGTETPTDGRALLLVAFADLGVTVLEVTRAMRIILTEG